MLPAFAANERMSRIQKTYEQVVKEARIPVNERVGAATYYLYQILIALAPKTYQDICYLPHGFILTPRLTEQLSELTRWEVEIFHRPEKTERYIAISAHLDHAEAKSIIKRSLEQDRTGVLRKVSDSQNQYEFYPVSEVELEEFLKSYKPKQP